jgi:hypothetical protein
MSESYRPRRDCLILAGLAFLGYLASLLPARAAIWNLRIDLSHSLSVSQQIRYLTTITLSFLQLIIVICLLIRAFCKNPESPRAFWYFVAILTAIMGLDFTYFSDIGDFMHTPDAIIDPLFFVVYLDRIVLGAWCWLTIGFALKIAIFGNNEATAKNTRALSREIMSRPEYGAFLAENPERQYLYWEDLPDEFERWLNPIKIAEQPGPAQPATQPADKFPAKNQPSTPMSKVSPR